MLVLGVEQPRRAEHGFTLTELLVAVVLMGLIVGPLSMALVQSFTILPQASARSQAAIERRFAIDAMEDDVANATTISHLPGSVPVVGQPAVPGLFGIAFCAANATADFLRMSWTDVTSRRARWEITYTSATATRSAMTLTRTPERLDGTWVADGQPEQWDVGYCTIGLFGPAVPLRLEDRTVTSARSDGFCPAAEHRRVCVALAASDTVGEAARVYRFTAALRTLDP